MTNKRLESIGEKAKEETSMGEFVPWLLLLHLVFAAAEDDIKIPNATRFVRKSHERTVSLVDPDPNKGVADAVSQNSIVYFQ